MSLITEMTSGPVILNIVHYITDKDGPGTAPAQKAKERRPGKGRRSI